MVKLFFNPSRGPMANPKINLLINKYIFLLSKYIVWGYKDVFQTENTDFSYFVMYPKPQTLKHSSMKKIEIFNFKNI